MLNIMIAVDGSPNSLQAVQHGVQLVQQGLRAHVVVAHVQKEASFLELATQDSELIANASLEAGMDLVAPALDVLRLAGVSYEVEIRLGDIHATLLDIAEEKGCGLIVIGATGESTLGSILIGSVSREVARHSRVPTTIVKMPEVLEADEVDGDLSQADTAM
ncbi:MAG: universal stress protein [Comamonas sp.]|jgi:nucleotide-binding universal stress UspA family protein|uniref:Universal stress protein n=1 Tax=Comamonas koreensis TaxID=160825 RepID=A0AAW4Y0I2_9BURK|nr:universal stress protein [Comamonas koreensis]MCD2167147.1 universal stress protein [Comamonas koreensis]MDR2329902.1 universal stress protein [Comamonas sp.]